MLHRRLNIALIFVEQVRHASFGTFHCATTNPMEMEGQSSTCDPDERTRKPLPGNCGIWSGCCMLLLPSSSLNTYSIPSRERATDMMPPGQESLMIIVDYKSTTFRTNPSVSVASKVLVILQQHYCERLGRAIVTNLPVILKYVKGLINTFGFPCFLS